MSSFDDVIVVMIGQHRGSGDERESLSHHINNPEVSHVFIFYFSLSCIKDKDMFPERKNKTSKSNGSEAI